MSTSLYRKEAREALKVQLEGEVVALTPPSLARLSVVFAIAVIGLGAFSATATYTRYASASGILAPKDGLVTVTAPLKGDIVTVLAEQGQQVQAGEPLAIIRNTQAQSAGADTYSREKALIHARKANAQGLHAAKRVELLQGVATAEFQVAGTRKTLEAARATAGAAELKAASSKAYLARQHALVNKGYLAPAGILPAEQGYLADVQAVQQAKQGVATLEMNLSNAEQSVIQARARLSTLEAEDADTSALLNLDESRLSAAAEAVVSSALSGTVAAVSALKGPVSVGAPLFVVAPPGPTYAHLYLDDSAAQKAKVGQRVSLQVTAVSKADSQKLYGTVTTLAAAPVPIGTTNGAAQQGYLAKVLLDSQSTAPAPLGARVEARLQVETKSLLGWVFDPIARGLRQTNFTNK